MDATQPETDSDAPPSSSETSMTTRVLLGLIGAVLLVVAWFLFSGWWDYAAAKATYEQEEVALSLLREGPFLVVQKEVPFEDRFSVFYLPDWKRRVHSIAIDRTSELTLGEGAARRKLFKAIGGLQKLEYLSLDRTDFGDADGEPLAGASSLATILARHTQLGDRGVAFLARSPALRSLHLTATPISPQVGIGLKEARGLRHLNLSDTSVDDTSLAELARLPALAILDLSRTKVAGPGLGVFAEHPTLYMLLLTGTPLDDSAADSLAKLANLKSLSISHTRMTPRALPAILRLPKLEYLAIAGIDLTDRDLEIFAGQPADRKLTVAISRSPLGEPTLEALREYRKAFPQVEWEE